MLNWPLSRCVAMLVFVGVGVGVGAARVQGPATQEPHAPGREAGAGGASFEGVIAELQPDQPNLAARREHRSTA